MPFDVAGSYGGCPIHGFGFTELIINWYGREQRDPWYTGGSLPKVPASCGDPVEPPAAQTGKLSPPPDPVAPPSTTIEKCQADDSAPACTYDATSMGGIGGNGAAPGGWTVKITRPGHNDPIVVRSFGGPELYACGTIKPGDHVEVSAQPGSSAYAGNPGICF